MVNKKKSIKEGKFPIELLKQLLTNTKNKMLGVIQGPQIGCDVAVLDYSEAILNAQDFYSSKAKIHIVFKTDPITFPTPDPGKYAVIVNANDVVTSGAIPFGFNATLLFPLGSTAADINTIQQGIERECKKQNIIILGGHTEVTSSVNTPIVSGAMIGFVPSDYYVTREISEGDVMLCLGWCAKEGVGIIASEGYDKLLPILGKALLNKLILLGEDISVVDIALKVNKKIKPRLMHDATEGGVLGAAYETIEPEGFGLALVSKDFPITEETAKLCRLLKIDPLRLISSGTLLIVTSEAKAKELIKETSEIVPIRIIGKITSKASGISIDEKKLAPPGPDAVIGALRKIEEGNF